jgi:hypothetical protein
MLERPLQAILITGEKKGQDVLQGHKTTTVRLGWRDYKPGMAVICGSLFNWCTSVNIIIIEHHVFKDMPLNLLKKSGYKHFDAAMADLKSIYPSIERSSKVTYVEWERN